MTRVGVTLCNCANRDICKASLTERNLKFSPGKYFWNNGHHYTHAPDISKVAMAFIRRELKKQANGSNLTSTGEN